MDVDADDHGDDNGRRNLRTTTIRRGKTCDGEDDEYDRDADLPQDINHRKHTRV